VRAHGQHTPKAPSFRLQPIQPQPNLHEIQQPKLLVVPRRRHPPIIVSSTEQASHRSGERKGISQQALKKKRNSLDLRNKGDSIQSAGLTATLLRACYRNLFSPDLINPSSLARYGYPFWNETIQIPLSICHSVESQTINVKEYTF
jgi:hypothetical protein